MSILSREIAYLRVEHDGEGSLLDSEPDELHARSPVFVGTESLIDRLEATLK